ASAEVETRSHNGLAGGDVLVARNRIMLGADQRANFVAYLGRQSPPAFFPGAHAALRPCRGIFACGLEDAARHGSKRVVDQVSGVREDREFAAPAQQVLVEASVRLTHADIVRPVHSWEAG